MAQAWLQMLFPSIAIPLIFVFFIAKLFHRNSKSKAATQYPIVGILPSLIKNRHRFHDWIADILSASPCNTSKFSRPVGIRGFVTANPANVEHLLKTNFENYEKGPRVKLLLHDFLGRGIFNVDGELWRMQRKVASYEFNTKSLRNFVIETVQWEIQNRLMLVLSYSCIQGGFINLQDVLQRFAFDNICRLAFGVDPACLHPSLPQEPFARAFDDATELSFGRFLYSVPFGWRIKRLLGIGSERKLREAIRVVDDFALGIIRSRRKEIADNQDKGSDPLKNDLLSRFMAAFDSDDVNDTSDRFLRDMIVSYMLAGRDTTSTSLTWFFWVLCLHPTVEEAIHHEITQVLAKRKGYGEEEKEKGFVFSYEELRDMQYLHAAVCESLRLYPPVPLDTKVALQDDVLPDGSVVGKGWGVDYSIYSMGRMENNWGEDCKEFKPERWFKNGEFVGENPCKFAAFNAGPRVCLGKEMAFIQMKSIVASVIHRYSLRVDRKYVPKYTLDFNMRMEGGMPVTVTKR